MSERRFLLVRLGSLGDIVHTFPAAAALRESFPQARMIWVTHPRWRDLTESAGIADEVWCAETRSFRSVPEILGRIRREKFETAIDYQGLWKSAALPFLGAVPRRVGFSSASVREFGVPVLYTERVSSPHAHIIEQNGDLSVRAGAARGIAAFKLHIHEVDAAAVHDQLARTAESDAGGGYVVVSPGGGWRSKCWPAERFGALCKLLRKQLHFTPIINCGPGDDEIAEQICRSSGNAHPVVFRGTTGGLMALLEGARCVIGGDTGPLHLAVALHTPAVALFGPTEPGRNGPYGTQDVVVRSTAAATTYARGVDFDPAMLAISVEEVFDAVRRRLAMVRA
jgi:ADP-heptose:LPS heptosyltransferase